MTQQSLMLAKQAIIDIPQIKHPFINYHVPNRLVAAASALFSILTQLKPEEDIQKTRKTLIQSLGDFEKKIRNHRYDHDSIAISCYMTQVCVQSMFGRLYPQQVLSKKFDTLDAHNAFLQSMIETAVKNPQHFIEVIELIYLCLTLGLDDVTKNTPEWQNRIQQLYYLIRVQREETEQQLCQYSTAQVVLPRQYRPKSLWSACIEIILVVCLVFCGMYEGAHYLLSLSAEQVLQELNKIDYNTGQSIKIAEQDSA